MEVRQIIEWWRMGKTISVHVQVNIFDFGTLSRYAFVALAQ